jgi:hypothetical protein
MSRSLRSTARPASARHTLRDSAARSPRLAAFPGRCGNVSGLMHYPLGPDVRDVGGGIPPSSRHAPIWLDESEPPRPVRRCLGAGPVYRFRRDHLRLLGWRVFALVEYVSWCDHGHKVVPAR